MAGFGALKIDTFVAWPCPQAKQGLNGPTHNLKPNLTYRSRGEHGMAGDNVVVWQSGSVMVSWASSIVKRDELHHSDSYFVILDWVEPDGREEWQP